MAIDSVDSDDIRVLYIDADSPAEVFAAATRWAAENDGGFAIEAITWTKLAGADKGTYELAIFYEPQ